MDLQEHVVSAFTEDQAARLTGLSVNRLRNWDRSGFFRPTFAAENRRASFSRVYSFKDIVALRVLSALRIQFQVSLQHLREVSEKLSHLQDDRWTRTTLYVLNRRVVFQEPESGKPREVVSGQYIVPVPLAVAVTDTKELVQRSRLRSPDQIGHIVRHRNINHNAPVLAGTRVTVAAVKSLHSEGFSLEEILAEYPDLTSKDVEAALAYEKTAAVA